MDRPVDGQGICEGGVHIWMSTSPWASGVVYIGQRQRRFRELVYPHPKGYAAAPHPHPHKIITGPSVQQ